MKAHIAIVLAIAGALGIGCGRRSAEHDSGAAPPREETTGTVRPTHPESFGYKCAWLAVAGRSDEQVVAALRLREARRASWHDGVLAAYGHTGKVFVSPALDGWVFVVGQGGMPQPGDSKHADEVMPFVTRLSRDLDTTVQYFFSHRIVETHAWVMAVKGKVVRAFGYSGGRGETLFNVGLPTDAEKRLNPEERTAPDEDTVMKVAGEWGINPQTLDDLDAGPGTGFIGEMR
jgi:hypothetical protein